MSKKIVIRSFVKGGNHGQYLQALGMKALIEGLMPEASISHLDYENHFKKELIIQLRSAHLPKFIVMRLYWYLKMKFSDFNVVPDISIYGSDMIWHMESDLFPTDQRLFGEGDVAKIKIAYAPSVGARGKSEPEWIGEALTRFDSIGVRDYQTLNMVREHGQENAELVIDPCFHLLGSKYDSRFVTEKTNSIFTVYSPLHKHLVNDFYMNLSFQSLPEFINKPSYVGYFPMPRVLFDLHRQLTDPLWTVKKIASSNFLLTNTFHGVMMALMTKTPFVAVTSPNLTARLDSPIADVFSSDRLVSRNELKDLNSDKLLKYLDDSDLNMIELDQYINSSKNWMQTALKSADVCV